LILDHEEEDNEEVAATNYDEAIIPAKLWRDDIAVNMWNDRLYHSCTKLAININKSIKI